MKHLLKNIFRPLYHFLMNKNEREFHKIHRNLNSFPRFKKIDNVKFLKYSISIVDAQSFIYQFKEIFVDEVYKFNSESKSPVIFDCGSNVGTSVLYFKSLFPDAKIISFEADPEIGNVLKQNLLDNRIYDVLLIQSAVWINNNGVSFSVQGADGGMILDGKEKNITSVRLKDFLVDYPSIDLLKIDIEGAEYEVLLDCKNNLDNVKNLFVEYHSFSNGHQKLSQILKILEANNFRYIIESVFVNKQPFIFKNSNDPMDLQLNIFAIKNT